MKFANDLSEDDPILSKEIGAVRDLIFKATDNDQVLGLQKAYLALAGKKTIV